MKAGSPGRCCVGTNTASEIAASRSTSSGSRLADQPHADVGAGIESPEDLHFIEIKTGAVTTDRIADARRRGRGVVTTDTYKSMAYARAAAALGIGAATGEIPAAKLTDDVVARDFSVFSNVASTSSGVELMNCEVIALGTDRRWTLTSSVC